MLDIAVVAAVLSLVVSVNGDLLTACKANESGIRPPLDLVHMRVPPPVSAFIAAVEIFFAARNLHDITATMLPQQMILWYQHVCAQHLYRLPLLYFLLQHLSSPVSIIPEKGHRMVTFFDRLKRLRRDAQ